ncbi:MAG: acetyl-CoA carboxylase biotin carboxylase subunit, partial [Acidobacteria bacterium]|nr:acetyl-CoA carboxylase biotin carboxylase subunit [Acidobacteriota bacterium]
SYLNISSIIAAAEITGADAIHPGYGFLSENAHFAEILQECQIRFIGPSPETIRLMGDKSKARETAQKAGVPIVPGSDGPLRSYDDAVDTAREIGFPIILKASAGGGGRGMRICWNEDELQNAYDTARNEAERAFGSADVYLEKYLQRPRHVEFQVFGDAHGRIVHMGERECSIQRRHQKLIEESPSPALSEDMRQRMGDAAIKVARAVSYENAGTIEFLVDGEDFYFMEMNTRIQVEHPVTEMVTLADIVRNQIRIAEGEELGFEQKDVLIVGHSIECRINAEDPEKFTPSPGKITAFNIPGGPGVRVDTAVYPGYVVPPFYDSMIAKLIVHARTRELAIARMKRALEMMVIEGIKTTIPLHLRIMNDEKFQKGDFSTKFMEEFLNSK